MSFFRKKKKPPSVEAAKPPPTLKEQPSVAPEPQETDSQLTLSNESDTTPTVVKEPSSIFGGMVLSSSVRKQEHQGSPYLSEGDSARRGSGGCGGGEGKEGDKGGREETLAFGFISQEPQELPSDDEESGFSFLNTSDQPPAAAEVKEKKDEHSSEHTDSSLTTQEAPTHPTHTSPSTTTSTTAVTNLRAQNVGRESPSQQHAVRNSSGALSPVPGPTSPPLTSYPSTCQAGDGGGRTPVGKQQPSANKKKKKRKVVRPGQIDDPILVDIPAEDVKSSSAAVEVDGKSDLDSVSLASQASSSVEAERDTTTGTGCTSTASGAHPTISGTSHSKSTAKDEARDGGGVEGREVEGGGRDVEGGGDVKGGGREVEGGGREVEGGGSKEQSGKDGVMVEEKVQSGLLVDIASSEQGQVEREGEDMSDRLQDQQLLAEVFAGRESAAAVEGNEVHDGEEGEGRGREEEGGKGGEVRAEEGGRGKGGDAVVPSPNYNVELTSSDQLTLLMQTLESKLATVRLDLAALHSQKLSSLDQHISAARQQRQNRQQMKELKARESKALSDEDYELAEELQRELESVSHDSSWSISTASHAMLQEWVQEVSDLMKTEETVQSDMRTQLAEMKEEHCQALVSAEESIAATHTKQKMKLKTLEDKIERERGHIALDKEHLRKREQQLQDEIASRAERFISKKSTLQEELQTVHSDISELEVKLAKLREEEVRLQAAISEEEEKIEAVHRELDSENSSLREERDSLTQREQELQTQQAGVDEVRQEYEMAQQTELTQKQSIADILKQVDQKWAESERRTHTLVQCLSRARDLGSMDISSILSPSQQLLRCGEAVAGKEGQVKEMAGRVLSVQGLISQLRSQLTLAEERLPQLEEAKKAAVAARQYKEAGRVSSELKQVKTELEPQRKQLSASEAEVSTYNQQLAALNAELAREREKLEQMEREEDVQHLKQLTSTLARLQATKASIPESSSPLEQVLDCWQQLYQLLADGLCAKHDLQLTDFTPHRELLLLEEREKEEEERDEITEDGCRSRDALSQTSANLKQPEERTPGVGREEGGGGGEGERDGGGGGGGEVATAELEEVKRKIAELESRIEDAVSEEVEDYELAADLDRELSGLKEKLNS